MLREIDRAIKCKTDVKLRFVAVATLPDFGTGRGSLGTFALLFSTWATFVPPPPPSPAHEKVKREERADQSLTSKADDAPGCLRVAVLSDFAVADLDGMRFRLQTSIP